MVALSLSITPAIIPHCCSNWNLRRQIGHMVTVFTVYTWPPGTNSDQVSPSPGAASPHHDTNNSHTWGNDAMTSLLSGADQVQVK